MSIIMSIFLGIVQGITEFLPVSSSGHLSILQNLFRLDYAEESHLFFSVLLHFGTLAAICIVYRTELRNMLSEGAGYLKNREEMSGEPLRPQVRTLLFIIIGSLPLILVLIFGRFFARLFYNTGFIGFALLVTGGILYVSDKYIKPGNKRDKTMTAVDALLIGLTQAVAVIPGLSRSGTTIAVGMSRGLDRSFAVRFSLFLSIPAVLGSGIITLVSAIRSGINFSLFPVYLVGVIVAAVVGYFSVQLLRRIVMTPGRFGKFAYYCWGVGILTIILSLVL